MIEWNDVDDGQVPAKGQLIIDVVEMAYDMGWSAAFYYWNDAMDIWLKKWIPFDIEQMADLPSTIKDGLVYFDDPESESPLTKSN